MSAAEAYTKTKGEVEKSLDAQMKVPFKISTFVQNHVLNFFGTSAEPLEFDQNELFR